jgi:hypothetical protein
MEKRWQATKKFDSGQSNDLISISVVYNYMKETDLKVLSVKHGIVSTGGGRGRGQVGGGVVGAVACVNYVEPNYNSNICLLSSG